MTDEAPGEHRSEGPADPSAELGKAVGERLRRLMDATEIYNSETGEFAPITFSWLFLKAQHRCGIVPFSERHLYRIAAGHAHPRLDTLWLLAELLEVHPAFFLGVDKPAPDRYPDSGAEPPNEITLRFSEKLREHVAIDPAIEPGERITVEELLDRIRDHQSYEHVSHRHIARLLTGHALPRVNTICAISAALGVEPTSFLE